jgi:hypothetical protein
MTTAGRHKPCDAARRSRVLHHNPLGKSFQDWTQQMSYNSISCQQIQHSLHRRFDRQQTMQSLEMFCVCTLSQLLCAQRREVCGLCFTCNTQHRPATTRDHCTFIGMGATNDAAAQHTRSCAEQRLTTLQALTALACLPGCRAKAGPKPPGCAGCRGCTMPPPPTGPCASEGCWW